MGKKNQRMAGRLNAVTAELSEATERATANTVLQNKPADDLFVVDVPKKRKRNNDDHREAKRIKEDASLSNSELVANALSAVEHASKAKVLVAKPQKVVALTKDQEKKLRKVAARMAARDPEALKEKQLLKVAETGAVKTADKTGGYNLVDVWEEGAGGPRKTLSRPKTSGVLARPAAAGTSYNPSVEDHQQAVAQAVAAEKAEEARRQLLLQKTMGVDRRGKSSVPGHDRSADRELAAAAAAGAVDAEYGLAEFEKDAEDAVKNYLKTLDEHDPDASDDDEDMGQAGSGSSGAAGAGASAAAAGSKAKAKAAPQQAAGKGKKGKGSGAADVDAALAELAAEESARASRKAMKSAARAANVDAVKAGQALPFARRIRDEGTVLSAVPLSEELTGSLRTMKALPAGAVVLDAMAGLVARGDTAARRLAHAPHREDLATGALLPVPMGTLRRTKKLGHPYKSLEFPRRKEFEPAAAAAKEAETVRHKAKVQKAAEDAARGAARKAARIEAARAMGLELPA